MSWITYKDNQIFGIFRTENEAISNSTIKDDVGSDVTLSVREEANLPDDVESDWFISDDFMLIQKSPPQDAFAEAAALVVKIKTTIISALTEHINNMSSLREYLVGDPAASQTEAGHFSGSVYNGIRNLYQFAEIDGVAVNNVLRLKAAENFTKYATDYNSPRLLAEYFASTHAIKDWTTEAHLFINGAGNNTDFGHPTHWGSIDSTARMYALGWLDNAPGAEGTFTTGE